MNEKTVGMLIGKKNVYEYPELSNAVTCMNYVKKETQIPPVLMMHGLADDLVAPELHKKLREEDKERILSGRECKTRRSGILDREEYGYCGKIPESTHELRRCRQ